MIQELKNLSGTDLKNALEEGSGKVTFEIATGLYQNIEIVCNDCAVDKDGKTNSYKTVITNVSVDTNGFIVNFWANKPLRWGTIAGVIILAAVGCILLVLKRKKKD